MVFKCQEDSYLKEVNNIKLNIYIIKFLSNQFKTVVVSCSKSQLETTIDGEKKKLDGYDVILENTIIFPEGGGQVCMQMLENAVEFMEFNLIAF